METKSSRRHKEDHQERSSSGHGSGKKKSKKGILKNSSSSEPQQRSQAKEYDVPNCSPTKPASRKSHRNSSSSCARVDDLDFEPSYYEAKERSHRRSKEVVEEPEMGQNIYDTPKITSVKWKEDLAAAYDIVAKGSKNGLVSAVNMQIMPNKGAKNAVADSSFYENIGFNDVEGSMMEHENENESEFDNFLETEGVYDFPRPRTTDTIYFNENFEDDMPTYDTPRKKVDDTSFDNDEDEIDCIECEYDIPKVREATLTPIEEEDSQEYDVPRNNGMVQASSEDNLYENQHFGNSKEDLDEPIYMNEINDDRSSGYRSSSSPSIHSEENLYENGAVALSSDELSSQGSHGSQENLVAVLEPERHDVAIETTHTLERLYSQENKKSHEFDVHKKEKHHSREKREQRDNTPEEGICLEFEEFNPEKIEKERKQQRHKEKRQKHKEYKFNNRDYGTVEVVRAETVHQVNDSKKSIVDKFKINLKENSLEKSAPHHSDVIYSQPEKRVVNEKQEKKDWTSNKITEKKDWTSNEITGKKDWTSNEIIEKKDSNLVEKKENIEKHELFRHEIIEETHNDNNITLKQGKKERKKKTSHSISNEDLNSYEKDFNPYGEKENNVRSSSYSEKITNQKKNGEFKTEFLEQIRTDHIEKIIPKKHFDSNITKPDEDQVKTKNARDRDRSVDVYLETVRQRTVRDKQQLTADLFERNEMNSRMVDINTNKVVRNCDKNAGDGVGLPSVRKLLARFENGQSEKADSPDRSKSVSSSYRDISNGKIANNPDNRTQLTNQKKIKQRKETENMFTFQENNSKTNVNEKEERSRGGETISGSKPLTSPPLVSETSRGKKEAEDEKSNHGPTKQWNPQYFVKSLYKLPVIGDNNFGSDEDGPISLDANQTCPSIEGYMERLPAGRKKSTLWNSWKKQYFVAKNGNLFVYSNKSQDELTEKLEMFGGQVDFMDSNMLGLQDRRGQYIVVKCASHKAAQEWESALSFHTMEDYSKTFISPSPWPTKLKVLTNVIVIDLGGASIRAGICGTMPYLPKVFFPSLMAVNPNNQHEKYFGFDALKPEVRSQCHLSNPLIPSKKVDKYSVDLVAFCGLLLRVFKDLQVDPKKYELQLSVPRNFNDKTKAAIASLLFDEFEVKAVNMGHQTVFTLHSYCATTGIVVDIGERMDIVPIVDGYKVQSGISRTATGGLELATHMRHSLLGRNYSLTSMLDGYVVRHVIEKLCYIPKNYDAEVDKYKKDETLAEKTVSVEEGSAGSSITIGTDRFETTEGIFKPEVWGLDQAGVHVLVKKAITECSLDARKEVTQSIFLSGGVTMLPGFNHRLEVELEKILPVRPKVHASPYRYHAAFLGASSHATSPAYNTTKIKREDWISGHAKNTASLWAL